MAEDLDLAIEDSHVVETPPEILNDGIEPETGIPVNEALERIKRDLELEKASRISLQRETQEAQRQAAQARAQVQSANIQVVSNSIETLNREIEILQNGLSNSLAIQDYNEVANIQKKISMSAAKLVNLENNKTLIEQRQLIPEPSYSYVDPVEKFARERENTGSPKSADWIRRHPECVTDDRLNKQMTAAHHFVVAQGIAPESQNYFEKIEEMLGYNMHNSNIRAESSAAAPATLRKPSPPAAPVSRNGSSNGSDSRTGRLTEEQRELCAEMGWNEQEYLANQKYYKSKGKL